MDDTKQIDSSLSGRLKVALVEKGLFDEQKFKRCLEESQRGTRSFIEVLYQSAGIPERELAAALSLILGYSSINISTFILEEAVIKKIPKETAKKYRVLPVTLFENTLTLALIDPTNLRILDDLRLQIGLRIKPVIALPSQLDDAIHKYYGKSSQTSAAHNETGGFEEIIKEIKKISGTGIKSIEETSDLLAEAQAAPVIQLVNHLLMDAIRRRSSDIFIEPWEKMMRVRYRIDGVLEEILNVPRGFVAPVISRMKVMSRLNIAEHRVPQDGRIKVRVLGREVDLRISILPTCFGEKACLRILDVNEQTQNLEQLGFGAHELEIIRRNAQKPHGMILVTGPTGSGKTTTLYSILKYLDSPEKNITTVEDPVEYQVRGINQVNVKEHVGLTFPAALRSILRQDPDIILIGEIRDQITMDIAIKSSLTGHLVLSTLHTNDATSAIVRMINMGIEPFLIASSILLISAQRLVRKLCTACKTAYVPDEAFLKSAAISVEKGITFYRAEGCGQCRKTGYRGRTVITELFEMKPNILEMIMKSASNEEIRRSAREMGMKTIRESGIEKLKEGVTTIEEILRVTSPEPLLQMEKVS